MGTPGRSAEYERAVGAFSEGRMVAALHHVSRAERLGYDADQCAGFRWMCRMRMGQFEGAWRESDAIASRGRPDRNRFWDGAPFTGRRVIIRCLHGYGDAIQFLRYARLIRPEAASITVETHPEMVSLLTGMPYVDRVITWEPPPPAGAACWDQQVEVMELPYACRTTLATIPRDVPYLSVSAGRRERSSAALGPRGRPRIGLLWGASDWNPARSVPLDALRPLLALKEFAFYSFQRGAPCKQLSESQWSGHIRDTSAHSREIADTAADLLHMDLLITVDTMAAHLAGALGVPVWVLLPYEADWRWMLERDDSPWYPTMRLFRQPARGEWRLPIRDMLRMLSGGALDACGSAADLRVHGCGVWSGDAAG